jgi:hypothetical protein
MNADRKFDKSDKLIDFREASLSIRFIVARRHPIPQILQPRCCEVGGVPDETTFRAWQDCGVIWRQCGTGNHFTVVNLRAGNTKRLDLEARLIMRPVCIIYTNQQLQQHSETWPCFDAAEPKSPGTRGLCVAWCRIETTVEREESRNRSFLLSNETIMTNDCNKLGKLINETNVALQLGIMHGQATNSLLAK